MYKGNYRSWNQHCSFKHKPGLLYRCLFLSLWILLVLTLYGNSRISNPTMNLTMFAFVLLFTLQENESIRHLYLYKAVYFSFIKYKHSVQFSSKIHESWVNYRSKFLQNHERTQKWHNLYLWKIVPLPYKFKFIKFNSQ